MKKTNSKILIFISAIASIIVIGLSVVFRFNAEPVKSKSALKTQENLAINNQEQIGVKTVASYDTCVVQEEGENDYLFVGCNGFF